MSTSVLGFFLLLVLQVWAVPYPAIEDAAYINQGQDLMAEESSLINWQKPLIRHRRHPYHYHGFHRGWDHNQHFPHAGCHGNFGYGHGSWSHHGPPQPFGFGPPGPPQSSFEPTPPYKTKLAPFEDGSNEYQPEPREIDTSPSISIASTAPTTPLPTPPPSTQPLPTPTTTTTLPISSTENDNLDIDLRIGT